MPTWLKAGAWGFLAGGALLIGAAIGYRARMSTRWIAAVMAFGSGVLISALAFELMDNAYRRGGLVPAAGGFFGGALLFTAATIILNRFGAKHRKRSRLQPTEKDDAGSGLAIALGALFDGVPESLVIGISMLEGGKVSFVTVIAIFLSNLPEGLSSAAGMKHAGRSPGYIFAVWGIIAVTSGIAAAIGAVAFAGASPATIAVTSTFAAGAILAMLVDTMIPEAFNEAHDYTGLIAVTGFLVSFALSRMFA